MDHRGETGVGLARAQGDALELLEFAEEILDEVAPLVDIEVDAPGLGASWMLRDDHLRAPGVQLGEDPVDVEGLVRDQPSEPDALDQWRHRQGLEALPRQELRSPPGCRAHRSGRRSWWSSRRASGRWPGLQVPFCALSVAVDLDDAAVDHRVLEVPVPQHLVEYAFENIGLDPVTEALEHCVPVAERLGEGPATERRCARSTAPPRRTVVHPASTYRIGRLPQTMRLDQRPLRVRQNTSRH